jgi:hypothetical protein
LKRVLLIAYLYPPIANSGTYRPLRFANQLPAFGWEPVVLTVQDPVDRSDSSLLAEIRDGTAVVRAPMANDVVGRLLSRVVPSGVLRARVASGVSWRLRDAFSTPDEYSLWAPTARRAALREFARGGFDAIWATGFPWTSLAVGRSLARTTRRPFIADFRDPWTGEDLFSRGGALHRWRSRRLERAVLRDAHAVVVLEDLVSGGELALPPGARASSVDFIPNGYSDAAVGRARAYPARTRGRARLVYTGVWKAGYGPQALYDAIASLARSNPIAADRLELLAAGFAAGPAARMHLTRWITELGPVSHDMALGLMKGADTLFLSSAMGKRLHYHLPGKTYEYLASGRPILAVASPAGALGRLLGATGGAVVIDPGDRAGLERALVDISETGRLDVPALDSPTVEEYEQTRLTGRLASILNRVTAVAAADPRRE